MMALSRSSIRYRVELHFKVANLFTDTSSELMAWGQLCLLIDVVVVFVAD